MRYFRILLTGLIALTCASVAFAADRPNILWISVEDIGPHLGCYGDLQAITPTLDRLAERGVRYTNAFTTCPVCATNRSSTITGMYPTTIGTHHMRCEAKLPSFVRYFPEYLRGAGYYCSNNVKTDYNFTPASTIWDDCSNRAHWHGRKPGQPFFAVFNSTTTHESQIWPRGEEHRRRTPDVRESERQDSNRVTPPPYYPNTPEVRRDWANLLENVTQVDHETAKILAQLEADGLAGNTIVFFWSDHGDGLPRAKRWPYDSGLHVPLIVAIPEKWRVAGQGQPGTVDSQLVSFVDLAPTVLNLAGAAIPAHMQGRAFLGPKLSPRREYAFSTRDRMDERYDVIRTVRDQRYRYIRNYMPWKPYTQHISFAEENETIQALRSAKSAGTLPAAAELFMSNRRPVEELYDLELDPFEIHNLAASANDEHRAALARLRGVLAEWEVNSKDLGLIPEPILRERERSAGDCLAILEDQELADSLARIREMNSPTSTADARLALCRSAIVAQNPVERYWGLLGLLHVEAFEGGSVAPSRATVSQLRQLLSDSHGVVRIAAAEHLSAQGDDEAVRVIQQELRSDSPWMRLLAVNALDSSSTASRQAIAVLEEALADESDYVVCVAEWALHRLVGRPLPDHWNRHP